MEEVLLSIGSVVKVENKGENHYMISGKRVIDFNSIKACDYYAVPYPEGLQYRKDNENNGIYFNHPEIEKVIHKCEVTIPEKESKGSSLDIFKDRKD